MTSTRMYTALGVASHVDYRLVLHLFHIWWSCTASNSMFDFR